MDKYPDKLGPSRLFGKAGYIFVYQDVRGRWMSEGEFVNMRPHNPDKKGQATSTRAPTPTTPSTGWSRTCRTTTARSGMWGISYPGFYTVAGMIDAHPALKAASPQAPVTDWFIGDDWHHNGAFFLPHVFNFMAALRPAAPRADQEVRPARSTTARPTATTSSSSLGPLANADAKLLQGRRSRSGTR